MELTLTSVGRLSVRWKLRQLLSAGGRPTEEQGLNPNLSPELVPCLPLVISTFSLPAVLGRHPAAALTSSHATLADSRTTLIGPWDHPATDVILARATADASGRCLLGSPMPSLETPGACDTNAQPPPLVAGARLPPTPDFSMLFGSGTFVNILPTIYRL
jgi:hypothetical protein